MTEVYEGEEPRVRNRSGSERCRHCEEGLAVIGTRPDGNASVEMYGPCPYCEEGAAKEFPSHPYPAWGRDGYWRGEPPWVLDPPKEGERCSQVENHMRMKLLMARYGGADVDPAVAFDRPEKERLAALSEMMKALG